MEVKRTYVVRRVAPWDFVPVAAIDRHPWGRSRTIRAEAQVKRDDAALHVRLRAWEKKPRAVHSLFQAPVWRDSCLEFFLSPNPECDDRYLNFETNARGALLLAIGPDRHHRAPVEVDPGIFRILPVVAAAWWGVDYVIPLAFLESLYGRLRFRPGMRMAGNFYKCGDDTPRPHYGCWNPVKSRKPDFHRPEHFGVLVLE